LRQFVLDDLGKTLEFPLANAITAGNLDEEGMTAQPIAFVLGDYFRF